MESQEQPAPGNSALAFRYEPVLFLGRESACKIIPPEYRAKDPNYLVVAFCNQKYRFRARDGGRPKVEEPRWIEAGQTHFNHRLFAQSPNLVANQAIR